MQDTRANETEVMVSAKRRDEAEEIAEFVKGLDKSEKANLLVFIRGAKFAKSLFEKRQTA